MCAVKRMHICHYLLWRDVWGDVESDLPVVSPVMVVEFRPQTDDSSGDVARNVCVRVPARGRQYFFNKLALGRSPFRHGNCQVLSSLQETLHPNRAVGA